VVKRAKRAARDDDHRQAELDGPVAHLVFVAERHAPAAHTFDRDMRKTGARLTNTRVEPQKIDRAVLQPCRHEGRRRLAKMDGVDLIDGQTGLQRVVQCHGILPVAGGDRLKRGRGMARETPRAHEPAGEIRLAHASIGARDEKVHEWVECRT